MQLTIKMAKQLAEIQRNVLKNNFVKKGKKTNPETKQIIEDLESFLRCNINSPAIQERYLKIKKYIVKDEV